MKAEHVRPYFERLTSIRLSRKHARALLAVVDAGGPYSRIRKEVAAADAIAALRRALGPASEKKRASRKAAHLRANRRVAKKDETKRQGPVGGLS